MEQVKKKSKKRRIILLVILVVWVSFISIDYYRYLNNSRPIFATNISFRNGFHTGRVPPTVYIGLGYRVVYDNDLLQRTFPEGILVTFLNLENPPPLRKSFYILFFEINREYAVPWDN